MRDFAIFGHKRVCASSDIAASHIGWFGLLLILVSSAWHPADLVAEFAGHFYVVLAFVPAAVALVVSIFAGYEQRSTVAQAIGEVDKMLISVR